MAAVLSEVHQIDKFRMKVLLSGLGLEIKGMKKKAPTCYTLIKKEFDLRGNKQKVHDQFKKLIEDMENGTR